MKFISKEKREVEVTPMSRGEFAKKYNIPVITDSNPNPDMEEIGYCINDGVNAPRWWTEERLNSVYDKADTFLDRLAIEINELCDKTDKLSRFFNTDTFKQLSDTEKKLLNAQFGAMKAYSYILALRIAYYERPVCNPCCCDVGTLPDTAEVPECGCNCCDCECDTTSEASE